MLWGDWKDAYGRVPKILQAITHFNPGTKWCTHTTGKEELHKGVMKPVMERVYWCFPQCVEAFKHCRPVISVDGTSLTEKYMGVLLITTCVDGEDRLVPLAFALVESENVDSWSWFLHLVRWDVVGRLRKVCIVLHLHQGILSAVEDYMEGYQPIVSCWCMRHFVVNIWHRQANKKVRAQLKLVCAARAERTFNIRLEKLKINDESGSKRVLEDQMVNKHKWANAFDEGGWR
jgi:hypothetical protein